MQAQTALCVLSGEEMTEEVGWDVLAGGGERGERGERGEQLSHRPCVTSFCSKAQLCWPQAPGNFLALVGFLVSG